MGGRGKEDVDREIEEEEGERRQTLRKLRREQRKDLIRETRDQMRKRMERPRRKETARLMGKRAEGTMSK